jgi:glycosyltransferase A (GT-A) superfamily protein (DUF2064 family)
MKRTLIVLADPAFGLIEPLPPGDDFQAQLVEAALKDSLALWQGLDFGPGFPLPALMLAYTGDRQWYAPRASGSWLLVPQMGLSTGQRLDNLLIMLTPEPEDETLFLGMRTPQLTLRDLQRAFIALHQQGTCLGATPAGGVYALGVRGRWPTGLLAPVHWHAPQSAGDVQRSLRKLKVGVAPLEAVEPLVSREDVVKLLTDVPAYDGHAFPFLKSMARQAGLESS